MTNRKYSSGREYFAEDGDWDGDAFKALLVDNAVTFNDSHRTIADISASIVSRSGVLSGKTTTDGKCGCDDATFTAPTTGHTVIVIIACTQTGVDATSPLIVYFDTGTNFPGTTSGIDMTFQASAVPYLFTT